MAKIRAVTLDFGGTLALGDLDRESYRSELLNYLRSIGFSRSEAQFNSARNSMLEKLMKVRKRNREMRFEDLYQGFLFKLEIHPESWIIDYIHSLYARSFKIELVNGVREVLRTLSEKYKLAIISNALSNVPRLAIERHDLARYFHTIVVSRDIGIRKPDPEIFYFTLNNLSVDVHEAVHVGDSLVDDVQGASSAGIKSIWISNDKNDSLIKPDYTIRNLQEIANIL